MKEKAQFRIGEVYLGKHLKTIDPTKSPSSAVVEVGYHLKHLGRIWLVPGEAVPDSITDRRKQREVASCQA